MQLRINSEQKIQITLNPSTVGGNPVQIDGAPAWEVIDGDGTLEVAEDGLSAFLVSGEPDVVTNFKVTADADVGPDRVEITDSYELTVVHPMASGLGSVAGNPVQK